MSFNPCLPYSFVRFIILFTILSIYHPVEVEHQVAQQKLDHQKQLSDLQQQHHHLLQQHQQTSLDQVAAAEAALIAAEATAAAAQRQHHSDKEAWIAEKNHGKTQIKALSIELKDSLRRENEAREISDTRFGELQKMMLSVNSTNVALGG